MVNTSQTFYGKAVNSTSVVDGYFTQEELDGKGPHIHIDYFQIFLQGYSAN